MEAAVSDAMKKEFLRLNPDMELPEVYYKMTADGSAICPVFEDGTLVGVVDKENLSEFVMVREALQGRDVATT
jgi:CBS domain-containing protein